MVCRAALDGGRDDLSCAILGFILVLRLDLLDLDGHLVSDVVSDVGDEVGLCLLNGEAGDLLQHFKLALLDKSDLLLLRLNCGDLRRQVVVLLLDGIELAVKIFFLLL